VLEKGWASLHSTTSLLALVLAATACGQTTTDDHQPNQQEPKAGSSSSESAGNDGATGGSNEIPPGGGGNSATSIGGSVTTGGAAGGAQHAGSNSGGNGGSDTVPPNPYAPRSGKFKMVSYSKTKAAFRLVDSIQTGTVMLHEIAAELGIEPPLVTEENTFLDDIDAYELVFFMNPAGDIFTDDEQAKFEAWMKRGGAFCGTSSATDAEHHWPFYEEIIGQNYESLGNANVADSIVFEASALDHPALVGLPNPWERLDTWRKFSLYQEWSRKPGFRILARKAADQEPITWVREHGGFRSFYTGIGWNPDAFQDPEVKKHLTGAIMWSVRREHCLVLPKPAGCP
jgi:hypothetical protein